MAKFQNIFYLLVAFLIPFINCECLNNDSCVCILDEYTKINITLVTVIDSAKGPEFISDSANNNITYEFYGCTDGVNYPYHNKTEVIASLIGVNTTNGTQVKTIGTHHQIQFHIDNELTQLLYRNATGSVIAAIDLICTTYPTPFIKIIAQDDTVRLALNSPHNCLITEHPGLSTGSVLLILFFISISIYLVCGGLILYFIRGARGFEMIPNNDFWRDLPGLVKDGVIFLFSGCNVNAIDAADTYDRI